MLSYVHPVLAVFVLAFLAYVAALGVRARNDRRRRAEHLRLHARLAPWMYAVVVLNFLDGLLMQWMTRPPAELAASGHFQIGVGMVLLLSAGAASSRWMHHAFVRQLHPWFGVATLLLAAAQVIFGLQLLP